MLEALYLNLGQHDAISEQEKALLAGAMSVEKHFATGEDIVAE
ncbi:MAG: Crp/Fnr family transcriptional regulator, partial [Mesorhizobium sp.]|nr:Crp/Fnr family transcriptional regulator [Mesorhizobium sp.]